LSYHARSVTGIDIDEELLDRARSHLSFRRSRIHCALPPSSALDLSSNNGGGGGGGGGDGGGHAKDRRQLQRPPPDAPRDRLNYFPISSIQKYGHLPAPPLTDSTSSGSGGEAINPILSNKHPNKNHSARTSHEQPSSASSSSSLKGSAAGETDPTADTIFPGRVEFKLEDWAAPGSENIVRGGGRVYDVILALSVVKWLHLEHGDQGKSYKRLYFFLELHHCHHYLHQ